MKELIRVAKDRDIQWLNKTPQEGEDIREFCHNDNGKPFNAKL